LTASTRKPRTDWPAVEQSIIDALGPDRIIEEYRTLGIRFAGNVRANGKAECYAYDRPDNNPSAYVDTITGKYGDKGGDGTAREITLWQVAADLGHYGGTWEAARAYFAELAQIKLPSAGLRGGGKRGRGRSSGRSSSKSSTNYRSSRKPVTPAAPAENYRTALVFEPWESTGASGRTYTGQIDILRRFLATHKPDITAEAFIAAGGRRASYKCDRPKKDDAGKEITDSFHEPQWTVYALPVFGETILTATPDDLATLTGPAEPIAYACWSSNPIGNPLTRWNAETKTPEPIKMKIVGSADGIFGLPSLRRRAAWLAGGGEIPPAVVGFKVEGPTDLLALETAAGEDFLANALAFSTAGGATQFNAWHAELYRGLSAVYAVGDHDRAGVSGVVKACGVIVDAGAVPASSVHTIDVFPSEPIAPKHGKDLRDYFAGGENEDGSRFEKHNFADFKLEMAFAKEWSTERHADYQKTDNSDQSQISLPTSNPTATPADAIELNEAADDPHRLAEVFRSESTANASIKYWREEWWVWNGRHYRTIGEKELKAIVNSCIKREFNRLNQIALEIYYNDPPDDEPPPLARKVTQSLVNNTIGAMQGLAIVPGHVDQPAELTKDEDGYFTQGRHRKWIAMANGILDVDRLLENRPEDTIADTLLPHTPDWFSPVCLPYNFEPDAAPIPKFTAFLARSQEGDPERIAILQEWLGYLLMHDTSAQKFLILEGEGANGKSVYCAVAEALIGRANCSHVPLESFHERFALTPTLGKLANIVAECGELDKISEGKLKSFTSGDSMSFDRKNLSPVEALPTARLMLATNNRPRFSDRSDGIWRRMIVIPWRIQIPSKDRIAGMDKPAFWEESGELPGIFNWAIDGLCRLRSNGFSESKLVNAASADYRKEANPAREFLLDYYEHKPEAYSYIKDVYEEYRKWSEAHGYKPLGSSQFGKEVARNFKSDEYPVDRVRETTGLRKWMYSNITKIEDPLT